MAGIAMGPHGADLAPKYEALMLIGEVGLVLLVLEAGLEVELSQVHIPRSLPSVCCVSGCGVEWNGVEWSGVERSGVE